MSDRNLKGHEHSVEKLGRKRMRRSWLAFKASWFGFRSGRERRPQGVHRVRGP